MERDTKFSEENIDTNEFHSLTEQSFSDETNEQIEKNNLCEKYYIENDKTTK